MTEWRNRIIVDPDVLVGKPIIRRTRISVELLLDRLGDGWTVEQILDAYPRLCRDDVLAAISFVSEVFREERFIAVAKASL